MSDDPTREEPPGRSVASARAEELERLFLAAVDLPEHERSAFLDRALAADDPLRDEVESLLAADGRADRVLGALRDAVDRDLEALRRARDDRYGRAGERIGPYVVEELIGRGGMGEVHRAHRDDQTYDARVAIKILPADAVSQEAIARFDQERKILAGLDHPNIARLLDAGTTGGGEPYFVMEYVEGLALDTYCDTHRLTVDERLRLFLRICGAVEQAHRNLVVHRDLKPANVRVTPDGVPKLLDFGIAKLLADDGGPQHEQALTRTRFRPMTPGYASPEQIEGGPITTGTDVYGLGLLLYRLLTGRLPHEGSDGLHRATVERDAPRPSSVCTGEAARLRGSDLRRLRRRLSGDLDVIALEALERDPARRYDSVRALAADVEGHLRGLPIAARRPTLRYRAAKFVRRHRLGVAAGATAALAVLALSVALAFLAVRLAGERDRARTEQRKAEEVVQLMVEMLSAPDPERARGEEVTAREVLDRGAARLDERLDDQPVVRASLLDAIGRVYHGLGLYDSATEALEEAHGLRVETLGGDHPAANGTLVQLALARKEAGDFAEAERLLREALAIEIDARGPDHLEVPAILDQLAELTKASGAYDEAERLLHWALEIRKQVSPEDELGHSTTLFRLGQILHERERLAEAEEIFTEVLEIQGRVLGEDHPDTMAVLSGLGDVLRRQGRGRDAEEAFRRLLSIQRTVLGDRHPRVAFGLAGVGHSLVTQGRASEAVAYFEESLALRREAFGDEHPAVMVSLSGLAGTVHEEGDLERAEALYRESLTGSRRLFPPGFPGVVHPLTGLGTVLLDRGRPEEAEPYLREALAIRREAIGSEHPLTAVSMAHLARCALDRGARGEASGLLAEAMAVLETSEEPVPADNRRVVEEQLERLRGLMAGDRGG